MVPLTEGDNVLAWQGHPELTTHAMVHKITPFITRLSDDERAAARTSFQVGMCNRL